MTDLEYASQLEQEYRLHPVWMELSRANLESNWNSIQDIVGSDITVIPMLKANAYGYGAVEVGQVLAQNGIKLGGVSSLKEALDLRAHGMTFPLLVTDYVAEEDLPVAFDPWMNTSLVLSDPAMFAQVEQTAQSLGKKAKVHVFIDTGMHREGILPQEALSIVSQIHQSPHVELEGIMTHLAQPTHPDPNPTYQQLALFNHILDQIEAVGSPLPQYIHAAEGASVMRFPEAYTGRFTAVRPGNILYGIIPGDEQFHQYLKFIPRQVLLAIKAKLANVKTIATGESVGYGRTQLDKDTKVGIVAIGHADGYRPSQAKQPIYMLVGGKRAPVLDREAMNQLIIGLPDEGNFAVGDEVVIVGKQGNEEITLDEVAGCLGTKNLSRITAQFHSTRLPRVMI